MGAFTMIVGVIIFLFAFVILMQPIFTVLDATTSIRNTAKTTMMYGTDSNGQVVKVGYADAGGDLTDALLYGIGFFMIIGFIVWLVMRAPQQPDFPDPYAQQVQGGRF